MSTVKRGVAMMPTTYYYCEFCGRMLDSDKKEKICPQCNSKLEWEDWKDQFKQD